jgi:hypothetical protein
MKSDWKKALALRIMIYIVMIAISILLVKWIWSLDIPDWLKILLMAK